MLHGLEPPREHVVVARSQVIEIQTAVETLATVEVRIRRGAGAGDRRPEGIERVRVGDRSSGVGQEARVAVAVVAVEAGRPCAIDELVFTDQLTTVGVRSRDGADHDLVHDVRVARSVAIIYEDLRHSATCGFADAVAVAVVNISEHRSAKW